MADIVPSAPNPSTAQARVLVDELARGGLRHAVVCPGSRSAALAIALHEDPRIATHVHLDERSAAFVALGIGRATGMPAAVVVTSGTAVANLLPATVEADHAGVPLLLLTADRPPELRDTGANQTIEQRGLLGPGLRWQCDLGVAEDREDAVRTWRAVAARALATASGALGGPPGPVQLNIPFREPTVPVADDGRSSADAFVTPLDGRGAFEPWVRVVRPTLADERMIPHDIIERCATTERGLIVVGSEVGGASAHLLPEASDALSRATGWPVIAEGHVGARHGARTLRSGSWLLADEAFMARHRPDLVVRVGRPTLSGGWERAFGSRSHQVLVDPHGGWHDPGRSIQEIVVAEPAHFVVSVTRVLGADAGSSWSDDWRAADAAASRTVDGTLDAWTQAGPDRGMTGMHAARCVGRSLRDGVPLVVGSSLSARDLDLVLQPRSGLQVFANRGVSGIDGTISTTLGVALTGSGAAVALVGDLTFLHDANGLLLSPASDPLGVTFVVVGNGGGRIFDHLPPARFAPAYERLFVTPQAADLGLLAAAHGLEWLECSTESTLTAALGEGPEGRRGRLLHVPVDPSRDVELRRMLKESVGAAISPSA